MIVELKAANEILPIHEAQAISYSELLKLSKAIIINFHEKNLAWHGTKTFVNEYFSMLPDE